MNKSLRAKIRIIVFLMLSVSGYFYFQSYTRQMNELKSKMDLEIEKSRFDYVTVTLKDKFEFVGPVEFQAMERERGTTYDHKIVWNIMRVSRNGDHLRLESINDRNSSTSLANFEKKEVDDHTYRNIIPLHLVESAKNLKENELIYVRWKNIKGKYSGNSVLDEIRKATYEEVVEYLKVERKFDEDRYGPFEKPDYKRFLYKLETHNFEDIGVTNLHLMLNQRCNENNYKKLWTLVKSDGNNKFTMKFKSIVANQGNARCVELKPDIFRDEGNSNCLIKSELVDKIKSFGPEIVLYSSWKHLRINKNECFDILDDIREATEEEKTNYQNAVVSGLMSKLGKYRKYAK